MNRRVNAVGTSILLALIVIGVRPVRVAEVARNKSANIAKATQQDRVETYGKLPLSFEVNTGQTNQQVKFLSRGRGYTLFLTRRAAAVLVFGKSGIKRNSPRPADRFSRLVKPQPEATPPSVLRMMLIGAKLSPQAEGLDELSGKANYFIGNDPKMWRTNVPTYARVRYRAVYPGVDLVYYGNQRQMEQDFVVAPGAKPSSITMTVEGAEKLSLDVKGDLVLRISDGEVRFQKPLAYQEINGVRREIPSSYTLEHAHQVSFQLGAYDATRPLIIDPVLSYSTYLGGSDLDQGWGIAVDSSGYAYVTGVTSSSNFPTTTGVFQSTPLGGGDAFVTKLNTSGSALVYSTYLGGSAFDQGHGIVVDASGNAFVTGQTNSSNFPTTTGAFQTTYGGTPSTVNAFVTKLNTSGSALVYSTYLGGVSSNGNAIAVDSAGNAFIAGDAGSGFPTTTGAFQTGFVGGSDDAFVTKLNPAGSQLVYSTYLGGSNSDQAFGIAVDSGENAYVTGPTNSIDFPTTSGAFQTATAGGYDVFVTKVNTTGTALVYSTYLGGGGPDYGFAIGVDAGGFAYVTGSTASANFPTTSGAFQTTPTLGGAAFVTKLNTTGTALVYSTYLGGGVSLGDFGFGIAVDSAGNAYVTGSTRSSTFPTTANAIQPTSGSIFGGADAFVTTVNPLGTGLVYSSYIGGTADDIGHAIALDPSLSAYIAGATATYGTSSNNFPTTSGAFQTMYQGGYSDAFVTKIANIVCTQKEDDDRDDHDRQGERDDHQRHNDRHKAKSHPCKGSGEMESEKPDSEKE